MSTRIAVLSACAVREPVSVLVNRWLICSHQNPDWNRDPMRRAIDIVVVFAIVCDGYVALYHGLEMDSVIITAGVGICIAWQHGRQLSERISRLLYGLAEFLERVSQLWNPSQLDSTMDRLSVRLSWDRIVTIGLFLVLSVLGGALFKSSFIPAVQEVQVERLRPVAPQPFEKRWQAPNAPTGVGGPAEEVAPVTPLAPVTPPTVVHKHKRKSISKAMSDPWSFPKF